jgi:hypothetical protein
MIPNETIVALATPSGAGAIAVIRISGKNSILIASLVFQSVSGKDINKQKTHTLHLGYVADGPKIYDQVLLSIFKNPNSYTGEDVVEISCHGSIFIQQQIIQLLLRKGCKMAQPGEFTLRAFLNGKLDLSQAEAVADLISSDNEASHQIAMQQMRGGFSNEIAKLREQTAVPPNIMEAKLKTFNLLVDFLTEKGTLTEEDYENMKVKLSSNVMTIDEAIDSLERLKLASKTVKRKEVQPEMKNWWSEMNRSELPLDMYIPKGSLVPSEFNNEFAILNTDKWTVPMPRPPVCIDSTPKDIMPMGTTGYPTGLKYFDEARYVTTGAKQEKEKKMVAFDIKQAKKEPVKESFTDTKKENCGCSD